MAGTARLLLVARAGPLADGLLGFLTTVPEVRVVGRVDELPPPLETLSELAPSVVVLAFGPSEEQNLAAVATLGAALPESKRVVLAGDVQQQCAAEELGADVVLLKGCRPEELVAAISAAATAGNVPEQAGEPASPIEKWASEASNEV